MSVAPSVTPKTGDDGVVLSLAGAWIIAAGRALETSAASLTSAARGARNAIIDLAGIERMDTAGAWVIDRARAELAGDGVRRPIAARGPNMRSCFRRPDIGLSSPPSRSARLIW